MSPAPDAGTETNPLALDQTLTSNTEPNRRSGRGRIYPSILDTIGDTPLVGLPRLPRS